MNKFSACKDCILHTVRRSVVQGRGIIPAKVLVIGEAPDKADDMIGVAFVGQSGRLLDLLLQDAGFDLETVYRTNVVLCYPSDAFAGKYREPEADEIIMCMKNIMSIIEEVKPSYVILAGDIAFKHYKKMFPAAAHISNPEIISRTGGKASPFYTKNKRTLQILSERMKTDART